jgi:tetratricopeptide (TPR) repeat protein
MFVIPVKLRFALIALGFVLGIGLWVMYGFWYGFLFLLTAVILLAGYIMLGTIVSTNQFMGQQRWEEAEASLKQTYFPKWLLVGYKGVYYMTHGALSMQKKDFAAAEKWLKEALAAGLPSDNERGAAILQLVMVQASRNNRQGAINQFADIKKLNITEPMLREQIKEVEKQLKMAQQTPMNPSMMALTGGRGFRQPGGKRKSPKVR